VSQNIMLLEDMKHVFKSRRLWSRLEPAIGTSALCNEIAWHIHISAAKAVKFSGSQQTTAALAAASAQGCNPAAHQTYASMKSHQ
jgi:hypothetical protein